MMEAQASAELSILYRRYVTMIRERTRRVLGDPAMAEDITQEALSRLRALRDKTCACAAPACAAEVTADDQALQRWVEDNRAKLTAQRTDAFEREWSSLKREVAACSAANASARGT